MTFKEAKESVTRGRSLRETRLPFSSVHSASFLSCSCLSLRDFHQKLVGRTEDSNALHKIALGARGRKRLPPVDSNHKNPYTSDVPRFQWLLASLQLKWTHGARDGVPPKVRSVYPRCAVVSSMITLCVKKIDDSWFGLAYAGEGIVATTIDSVKERVVRSLVKSSPSNVERRIAEDVSEFAERTLLMMKELESGREEHKRFSLADEYFPAPILKVLQMAAAIPIGYVTSYGNIAKLAGTDPRVVGQIMANNPLYPIVPCHRVVGSDFSLVGYGGRKSPYALQAKLTRLSREAKGFTTHTEIPVNGRSLTVYPVEHVIQKAAQHQLKSSQQRRLFEH